MQKEIWKDIKGYESLYQVSNFGNVKRLPYKLWNNLTKTYSKFKGKIKILSNDKDGYKITVLHKNSKPTTFRVHRLVGINFINNTDNKPVINHKNGIKYDNHIENLEWCTRSENDLHAYKLGLRTVNKTALGKKGYDSFTGHIVKQYSLDGILIAEFGSMLEAKRQTGISHICSACNGKRKTAGGFIWEK